jgi:hypothetical protein
VDRPPRVQRPAAAPIEPSNVKIDPSRFEGERHLRERPG